MRGRFVLISLAATGAIVVSAAGASANGTTKTTTIRVISQEESGQFVDNPPTAAGPEDASVGDMFVFTLRLSKAGRRVGRGHVACTMTQLRPPVPQCVGTFRLTGGQITVQGLTPPDDRPFTVAITGGTRRYAGARGTLRVRPLAGERERLTFRIRR